MSVKHRKTILYIQYANPGTYPPVQHSAAVLAQHGYEILLLGVGTFSTGTVRVPSEINITTRCMTEGQPGLRQKLHYFAFVVWAAWTALRVRPRWLYVSDLPATPLGLLLSFLPYCGVIYHEHDSPNPTSHDLQRPKSLKERLLLWTRRQVSKRAKFCVLPNKDRTTYFVAETQTTRRVFSVWNCPSLTETKLVTAPGLRERSQLTLFFHGSIVPQRLPVTLLEAMSGAAADVQLRFAGYETVGHRGYIREFLDEANRLNLTSRVGYLGALPRNDLLRVCRKEGHVGVSLLPMSSTDVNMRTMVGASNKPFDYLLCGLPLLVSDLADWRECFIDANLARGCDPGDPGSIRSAIDWYANHPTERLAMGAAGRERILREWNYEVQFAEVERYIDQTVDRSAEQEHVAAAACSDGVASGR